MLTEPGRPALGTRTHGTDAEETPSAVSGVREATSVLAWLQQQSRRGHLSSTRRGPAGAHPWGTDKRGFLCTPWKISHLQWGQAAGTHDTTEGPLCKH